MSADALGRAAAAMLALISAGVAVTCASEGTLRPVAPLPVASAGTPPAGGEVPVAVTGASDELASSASVAGRVEAGVSPATVEKSPLASFCRAAAELGARRRADPVRILWLGDSHTYADFLTHVVRRRLQEAYGDGGPGFVHVGVAHYRHGAVRVDRDGPWRVEPPSPARSTQWQDGVFGLGGLRAVPEKPSAKASLALAATSDAAPVSWTVFYRLTAADSAFEVRIDDRPVERIKGVVSDAIQSKTLEGQGDGKLEVGAARGEPQLFGVVVERRVPGLVLDTLGINGARAATPLGWDEASWEELVRLRAPQLVVLAYGTNEVFDSADPERYARHYRELWTRIRKAQSGASCLLLGPTDVALPGGGSHERVGVLVDLQNRVAAELGCGFLSLAELMGGEGSLAAWAAAETPLAARDRVHLTPRGYERLGAEIARGVLSACRP